MTEKAKEMWLFTNRQCLVFDKDGIQIPEYQAEITCYSLNKEIAKRVCEEATEFHICSFKEWEHPITKRHMMFLLGLVERDTDGV